MRILHTGDWHVGKVLKGLARFDEHVAVLGEIVDIARRETVDVVLVAGDVFESAAPPAEAQRLAYTTLLALRATGAEVAVIAGNHDHGDAFEAVRGVFGAAGVTVLGRPARADAGGVVTLDVGRAGERLRLSLLPFVSQRGVVRAEQLMAMDAAEVSGLYSERLRNVVAALTAEFTLDAVNVVMAHGFVRGGVLGGGERDAQTVNDYAISPLAFPASCSYVALGHLHRRQQVAGACPIWYPGSPIGVDFGEENDDKGVLIVDVEPGLPARVRPVPLASARRLLTVEGTLEELSARAEAGELGDALLRVKISEPGRPGLADDVRALLPNAIDIRLSTATAGDATTEDHELRHLGRSPHDLFAAYMTAQHVADERLIALFQELLDDDSQVVRSP
jgi:exonuclease SbcD